MADDRHASQRKASGREHAGHEDFARATAAAYFPEQGLVVVDLESGAKFAFPPRIAQGLAGGAQDQLQDIEITPGGYGLLWPKLDAALSVRGMLLGFFGSESWTEALARRDGRMSAVSKAVAARTNRTHMPKNSRIGASLDDFLEGEGIFETTQAKAIKEVIAWQLAEAMKAQSLSKTKIAALLRTSRSQVDRLLDPTADVKLSTLERAAALVGRRVHIDLI
jgi:hypothetical protein